LAWLREHRNKSPAPEVQIEMAASPPKDQNPPSYPFWLVPTAIALSAVILLWLLSEALLVIFASIVIAVGLTGLAKPITTFTKLPHVLAVLIATIVVVLIIGWPFSYFGTRLWAQFDEIARDIPAAITSIKDALEGHASVQFLEENFEGFDFSRMAAPVAAHLTSFVSSVGTVLSYVIILLFGGVYLAMDPDRYVNGAIYLTPQNHREIVQHFLARSGTTLRMWLFTQLLVVLMNGAFAGAGLWAFGVEGAAALAMLGGALSFIPYVGTLVAMVIGGLAALPQGVEFSVYALIVFGAASFFEGYLITPYIQSKTLSLPPVILIFSIFGFTILFGMLGVILAAPLTVICMVALDTFYHPAKI
jgi:predicted PurR-regulated permease PerM